MKKQKSIIVSYIHCANCMSGKLSVGLVEKGDKIEVYCEDCENYVVRIPIEPVSVPKCSCCNKPMRMLGQGK